MIRKVMPGTVLAAIVGLLILRLPSTLADARMVLQPWLLSQGFVQYVEIADEHSPLLPQFLAWVGVLFAHDQVLTLRVVHGLLLFMTLAIMLVWTDRRYGLAAAFAAAVFMWRFSAAFGVWALWYDFALAPIFFLFFVILARTPISGWKVARSVTLGLLIGFGFLVKQHAVVLAFIFLIDLVWSFWRKTTELHKVVVNSFAMAAGCLIPVLIYVGFYLPGGGRIDDLFYWMVWFNLNSGYQSSGFSMPGPGELVNILPAFLLLIPYISGLAVSGALSREERHVRVLLSACALATLVFVFPRYSTPHLAATLPFLGALSGTVCGDVFSLGKSLPKPLRYLPASLYATVVSYWLAIALTVLGPYLTSQAQTELLKFGHLGDLAAELQRKLPEEASIVILPDNEAVSNLYYVLGKAPPRYWAMHYPWFMRPEVKEKWLIAAEQEDPDILLYVENLQELEVTGPELLDYMERHFTEVESFPWETRTVHILKRREAFGEQQ